MNSRLSYTFFFILVGLLCFYADAPYTLVELGVVFYLNPQPRLDPRKNQNGTMAKNALFMEKFISAESVR